VPWQTPVVSAGDIVARVPREWLVAGYEAAYERFRDAAANRDDRRMFVTLFEALGWAGVLEERMRPPDGSPTNSRCCRRSDTRETG
jgi:hypothetical protein